MTESILSKAKQLKNKAKVIDLCAMESFLPQSLVQCGNIFQHDLKNPLGMRILILTHAYNSLAQRIHCELAARGHALSVELTSPTR